MKTTEQHSSIAQWQQWMLKALIHPKSAKSEEITNRFTQGANLSPAQCLEVYQRGYILRLTKCLAEQFPALCHALGTQLFEQFACRYLQDCPSDSYTLYELGRRFPDFLEQDRPDKDLPPEQRESWIDFMVDLANYERLHFTLFDAPGHEGKPWPTPDIEDSALKLQPCFALANYRYCVGWYYHAIKDNPEARFPPQQASYVALLRTNYHVTTFPINQVHYQFLAHLKDNDDVSKALQHISTVTNNTLERVTQSWREEVRHRWIEAGFFIDKNDG